LKEKGCFAHNNSHVGSLHKYTLEHTITVVLDGQVILAYRLYKNNKNNNYAVFTMKIASLIEPREKNNNIHA